MYVILRNCYIYAITFFYSLGAPKFKSNPIKKSIIVFLGTNILHIYFDLYKLNIVTKTKLEKNGKKCIPSRLQCL